MYKEPIELYAMIENITEDMYKKRCEDINDATYNEVLRLGINVNKEQLLKALKGDREQYQCGFEDGKRYMLKKIKQYIGDLSDIVYELDGE